MNTNSLTLNLEGQVRPPESVVDQDVAWHYGDPLREQKNLIQGLGAVDISNRGVIKIAGNDRKAFLHSLTSQHIERMKAGESCSTLLLTPNGHIEHELHVINSENEIFLIVEKSSLTPVLEFFKKMVFMSQVEITDQTSILAAIFESYIVDFKRKLLFIIYLNSFHEMLQCEVCVFFYSKIVCNVKECSHFFTFTLAQATSNTL